MWSVRESNSYCQFFWLLQNIWILFSYQFLTVVSQCGHGLESTCVWNHDPKTALFWQMKRDSQESYVELTKCDFPDCGIASIQTPWLQSRDTEVVTTLNYKIYGTSDVFLRLNLKLEDATVPYTIYSTEGNYAYSYPESWTSVDVRIPPTHTKYKLFLKAYIPYNEALVAVRDINLDGRIIITSTESTTTSTTTTTTTRPSRITSSTTTSRTPTISTTTTIAPIPPTEEDGSTELTTPTTGPARITSSTTTSRTPTSSTTTTIAPIPPTEEDEISPTHYVPDIEDVNTHIPDTIDDYDYFPSDEDDEENERRFQALQVQNFIGEEDLTTGFTEVT